ncbi:MAG: hypothetical protein LBM71_03785 [Elusimicrobiota bacterium]|jgi:acyl-ACP thioesterase|nr:hypothetical protein [Elusimicrobiota bacterium]
MYEETFKIKYHEMGPDGKVPLWALQNYFQEAAGMDAHNLSFGWEELSPQGVAWILTKMQFVVLKEVDGARPLKIKTWHCLSDKIQSRRDFVIYDDSGVEVLKGVSWWLILDLAKRKIVRSPKELLEKNKDNPAPLMEPVVRKSPSFEGVAPLTSVPVIARLEDIDPNDHVNNAHFSAWAIAAAPKEVRQASRLKELFVNFKAEVKLDDKIIVNTYPAEEENTYWHILVRQEEGGENREIASVYTAWQAK